MLQHAVGPEDTQVETCKVNHLNTIYKSRAMPSIRHCISIT